jgi:hypothetical protein
MSILLDENLGLLLDETGNPLLDALLDSSLASPKRTVSVPPLPRLAADDDRGRRIVSVLPGLSRVVTAVELPSTVE